MHDVAAAVGFSKAALYYHFSNKDQLYLDAVAYEFRGREAALKAMLAGNGTHGNGLNDLLPDSRG